MTSYFKEDTLFNPRNIDTEYLQSEMDYFTHLHQWYSHWAVIEGDETSRRRAVLSFAISETLKAVLALSIDGEKMVFDKILAGMIPSISETMVTEYNFVS